MVATDQAASVVDPSIVAAPSPPRSFCHATRYRRMLSVARPVRPMTPAVPPAVCPAIAMVGAVLSMARQRRRSASSMPPASTAASSVAAPPQPINETTAAACAIASIKCVSLRFIIGASFCSVQGTRRPRCGWPNPLVEKAMPSRSIDRSAPFRETPRSLARVRIRTGTRPCFTAGRGAAGASFISAGSSRSAAVRAALRACSPGAAHRPGPWC